jgi:hypothetical protein
MKIIFLYFIVVIFYGCSFKKIGSDIGQGVADKSDTIARNLVYGAVMELTQPANELRIKNLVDSLVASLADTLTGKVTVLDKIIFNPATIQWADSLMEALTGQQIQLNIQKIQHDLIGKTRTDVVAIKKEFSDLLNQILSSDTRGRLTSLRDVLLGDSTNRALTKIADTLVSHLVDSAMVKLSRRYESDVDPLLHKDIGFIARNATGLLITLGAIAVAIILLVWWSRRKYLHLTTLLTKHINAIPDQEVYDTVASNIKNDAMTAGLESDLRDVLSKNGLLGTAGWRPAK